MRLLMLFLVLLHAHTHFPVGFSTDFQLCWCTSHIIFSRTIWHVMSHIGRSRCIIFLCSNLSYSTGLCVVCVLTENLQMAYTTANICTYVYGEWKAYSSRLTNNLDLFPTWTEITYFLLLLFLFRWKTKLLAEKHYQVRVLWQPNQHRCVYLKSASLVFCEYIGKSKIK